MRSGLYSSQAQNAQVAPTEDALDVDLAQGPLLGPSTPGEGPAASDTDGLKPVLLDQLSWTLGLAEKVVKEMQERINVACAASKTVSADDGRSLNLHLSLAKQLKMIIAGQDDDLSTSRPSNSKGNSGLDGDVQAALQLSSCLAARIVCDLQREVNENIAAGQAIDFDKFNRHIRVNSDLKTILEQTS